MKILAALHVVSSGLATFGQIEAERLRRLDSYVEAYARKERIPGVAVAVVHGTNLVFSRGYGEGISPQTPFKIGSLSKSFTALAIMQLVEQGKLDLDSPVQRYLPWFRTVSEVDANKVTVRHLLHHRSGLSSGDHHKPDRDYGQELKNLMKASQTMFVKYPPGERFRYWNTGYDLLGAIVSAVSGVALPDYIEERIFKPLQMNRSYVSIAEACRMGLAGYRFFFGFPYRFDSEKHHPPIGAGGLISSAEDMARYAAALMAGGMYQGGRLLEEQNTALLFEPYKDEKDAKFYAMGWGVREDGQPRIRIINHGGTTDEFHSNLAFCPEQKLGVVILANASDSTQTRVGRLVHATTIQFLLNEPLDGGSEKHPMHYQILAVTSLILATPVLQVLGLCLTVGRLRRWRRSGAPIPTKRVWLFRWWAPLAGHILVALVMFWVLPSAFGLSLRGFIRAAPDWASLAILAGSFALVWGTVRSIQVARVFRRR